MSGSENIVELIFKGRNLIGPAVNSAGRDVDGFTDKSLNKLRGLEKAAMGVFAGVAGAKGLQMIIEPAMNREKWTTQMAAFTGDLESARKEMAKAIVFADTTPFMTSEVVKASLSLKNFMRDDLELRDALTLTGDAAAKTGQDIGEVANWVGRAYTSIQAGQPFGEASMRLLEMGIISGEAKMKFDKLSGSGKSASEVWAAFRSEIEKSRGAMALQASTLGGLWSTLKSLGDSALGDIGTGGLEEYKSIVQDLIATMNELKASGELQKIGGEIGESMRDVYRVTKDVVLFIARNKDILMTLGLSYAAVRVIGAARDSLGSLQQGLSKLAASLAAKEANAAATATATAANAANTGSQAANTAATVANTAAHEANAAAKMADSLAGTGNTAATITNTAAQVGNTAVTTANTAAQVGNVAAKGADSLAETGNTVATAANTTAQAANTVATVANSGAAVAAAGKAGALTTSVGGLATGVSALSNSLMVAQAAIIGFSVGKMINDVVDLNAQLEKVAVNLEHLATGSDKDFSYAWLAYTGGEATDQQRQQVDNALNYESSRNHLQALTGKGQISKGDFFQSIYGSRSGRAVNDLTDAQRQQLMQEFGGQVSGGFTVPNQQVVQDDHLRRMIEAKLSTARQKAALEAEVYGDVPAPAASTIKPSSSEVKVPAPGVVAEPVPAVKLPAPAVSAGNPAAVPEIRIPAPGVVAETVSAVKVPAPAVSAGNPAAVPEIRIPAPGVVAEPVPAVKLPAPAVSAGNPAAVPEIRIPAPGVVAEPVSAVKVPAPAVSAGKVQKPKISLPKVDPAEVDALLADFKKLGLKESELNEFIRRKMAGPRADKDAIANRERLADDLRKMKGEVEIATAKGDKEAASQFDRLVGRNGAASGLRDADIETLWKRFQASGDKDLDHWIKLQDAYAKAAVDTETDKAKTIMDARKRLGELAEREMRQTTEREFSSRREGYEKEAGKLEKEAASLERGADISRKTADEARQDFFDPSRIQGRIKDQQKEFQIRMVAASVDRRMQMGQRAFTNTEAAAWNYVKADMDAKRQAMAAEQKKAKAEALRSQADAASVVMQQQQQAWQQQDAQRQAAQLSALSGINEQIRSISPANIPWQDILSELKKISGNTDWQFN